MSTCTVDDVISWQPCYDRDRVVELFAGRASLSVLDILDLDIPAEDRLWAVLREELIPAALLHEFACWCAETALATLESPDQRSVAAIAAKRAWLRGEIGDADLAAARAAAWAAAGAALDATRAAAMAARAATWDAAGAARAAARAAQLDYLRNALADGRLKRAVA